MNPIEEIIQKNKSKWGKKTKSNYYSRMNRYFNIIGVTPEQYIKDKKHQQEHLEKAWDILVKSPHGTRKSYLSAIKIFHTFHNLNMGIEPLQFHEYFKDKGKEGKGTRAITQDKVPTNEELKKMLMHTNLRGKALFLVTATSGMRIDTESLKITWSDVDLKSHPELGIITIPGKYTKTGNPRTCFITHEAKMMLLDWEKHCKEYLESIKGKCNLTFLKRAGFTVKTDDPRVFPFSYGSALKLWHEMIISSGFTEKDSHEYVCGKKGKKTHRYKYHIHALRKYAKTRLNLAGVPEKIVCWIVGHEGYLSAYDRPDIQELIPHYLKAQDSMLVFGSPNLSKISTQVNELRTKNKELEELYQLQKMKLDIMELKLQNYEEKGYSKP